MEDPQQHFRWALLLTDCMKQLSAEGLPFVDQEVLPRLDGEPSALTAWFICEHHAAREKFDLPGATEALRNKMRAAGFPLHAVQTLRTAVTSQTEIQAGGGRFYFFR